MALEIRLPYDFVPRVYQLPLFQFIENGGKRASCVWHRRAGKDLSMINLCAVESHKRIGLYWHLFPTYNQGRKIAWQGMTKDGRKFLDHFPKQVVSNVNNTEMRLELTNGSIYQVVGTDNVDRLVGANPVGCIFSEWSLMDPRAWDLIRPILAENEGWAVFIYTPRGHNHGYDLWNRAMASDKWFSQMLTVPETRAIPMSAIEEDREAGMPEELIQQEYFCSFEAAMVGSYYGQQMKAAEDDGRITEVPWEPEADVHTAWDLGVGDSTVIWFFQTIGNSARIIDYYEQSGEGLPHYANVLRERPYVYGRHFAPHDIQHRELGSGKSRIEIARELGIKFEVAPKLRIEDGIEAVRALLPKCYFDRVKCERGVSALKQYRKEWDDKLRVFKDRPLHDWTSHAADGFRTMGVMARIIFGMTRERVLSRQAEIDYDPYDPVLRMKHRRQWGRMTRSYVNHDPEFLA